ncbi:hypothetical protein LTR27_012441 [Elasticomyces elasticus]|nr:hypothetical protein LTR27_012441 [Elasticomyces elasticus]
MANRPIEVVLKMPSSKDSTSSEAVDEKSEKEKEGSLKDFFREESRSSEYPYRQC